MEAQVNPIPVVLNYGTDVVNGEGVMNHAISEQRLNNTAFSFASSIWGLTAGAVIGEAINARMFWPMHITPLVLPINTLIFPFRPYEGLSDLTKVQKLYRISSYFISIILGGSATILVNNYLFPFNKDIYSTPENTLQYCLQAGFLAINLISSALLRHITPSSKQIGCCYVARRVGWWFAHAGREVLNYFTRDQIADQNDPVFRELNEVDGSEEEGELELVSGRPSGARVRNLFDPALSISEREALIRQETIALREQNRYLLSKINNLQSLLDNDPELMSTYTTCINQTKEILMNPPERDRSPPHPNPLVEEWKQEMIQADYLESVRMCILDFLQKNPDFCEALRTKIPATSESPNIPLLF